MWSLPSEITRSPRALSLLGGLDHTQAYPGNPLLQHADGLGRTAGQVDDPARDKRATVVDAHLDRLVIVQIVDSDHGAEGVAAMGCGQGVLVDNLAAGGAAPLKFVVVIGGKADGSRFFPGGYDQTTTGNQQAEKAEDQQSRGRLFQGERE